MSFALGPIDVHEELARGGMGVVFRAEHRSEGLPVAVKVVSDALGRHEGYAEDFRREVQSAAQLTHPNVVTLFEYGTVTAAEAAASDDALVPGCPFLVMELADSGSLADRPPEDWPTLRRMWAELLGALGHAHARSVVHRDLKPGNVLLHRGRGARPRVKLADFGLAHASDRRAEGGTDLEQMAGTPAFMAPEQVECRWRDFGPWTDLYALGIMTFHLACGRSPYEASHPVQLLLMHMTEPMPPLVPRFDVPDALDGWVQKLTRKNPAERFRRAADALHALEQIDAVVEIGGSPDAGLDGDPGPAPEPHASGGAAPWDDAPSGAAPWTDDASQPPTGDAPPWASDPSGTPPGDAEPWGDDPSKSPTVSAPPWARAAAAASGEARRASDADAPADEGSATAIAGVRPPVPKAPADADESPSISLHGAGLGLYFLRTIPLVDRAAPRADAWSALRDVEATGRPRAIVLRGTAGTGKSRIAEWICAQAHETGAATVLRAVHEVEAGPSHGMPRMIAAHYGTVGLAEDQLTERLDGKVHEEDPGAPPDEARALAELIAGSSHQALPGRTSIRFASPVERYATVERVFERAARERAVLVWLDDVQWGGDSVAMVAHAIEALEAEVLFVLTVREEALAEREVDRARLEALEAMDRVERLPIGPLAEEDTAALVERLLGLSGDLAAQVRRQVRGNPLFAVQLVGDWVQRDVLQLTPRGFALRPGERIEIPADLGQVWGARIDRALSGHPPEEREALELAAVLGLAHDADELDAIYAAWGRRLDGGVLEALIRARLVERTEAGWSFAHGMLRDALRRGAREAGRADAMHRACARVIGERGGRGSSARRGTHLAEAGEHEAALEPLLDAAIELRDESDYGRALSLLRRREELMNGLRVAEDDPRWGHGWALRADIHRLEWDFDSARTWAENARVEAEEHGWEEIRAEACIALAHCERQQGNLAAAIERNQQALRAFQRLDHDDGRARALLAMAIIARQQGEFERAQALYARAYALFELTGDDRGAANAMLGLAHVARHEKAWSDAQAKYADARARCERAGYRAGEANCLMGRADVQRYQGELGPAEDAYREALRIQTRIGSKATLIARLNLGLVLLAQDRFDDAREVFEGEIGGLERSGKRAYLGWVHHVVLPCVVHAGDLEAFDAHAAAATALAEQRSIVDEDMASSAERAGDMLVERSEAERAAKAFELAEAQWRALGDDARADAVRSRAR